MRLSLAGIAALLVAGAWLNVITRQLIPAGAVLLALLAALPAARRLPAAGALAAGFGLFWLAAGERLADRLPAALEGRDVEANVLIVDFPEPGPVLRLVAAPQGSAILPDRIRLGWYHETRPAPGECWRVRVRLRQPRGFANPGRFDYERWLFVRGYGATGYVRQAARQPDCDARAALTRLRVGLATKLRETLPDDPATAVLLAVTLGARQWLDDERWQQFAVTGTSHLMAISGMHVALASGAVFLLARALFGITALRGHQAIAAALLAGLFATGYALLSGFAVPARRALAMLAVAVLAMALRRPASSWQVLGAAGCLVFLSSPIDALSTGFRLSFCAVILLLLFAARGDGRGGRSESLRGHVGASAAALLRLQLFLLAAMLPLTAALFGRLAWTSVPVNLVAVPLFGFVALPAALAGAVLPGAAGDMLLVLAWQATTLLLVVIDAAAGLPFADLRVPGIRGAGWLALVLTGAAACLPAGWPGRRLAVLAVPLLLGPARPAPPTGCLDVDVLDVGQGLSVVLRTSRHTFVYDAGPAFRSGSDTGKLVVVPFLEHLGIQSVDRLVVSHADNDHAGGVRSLLDAVRVGTVLAGESLLPAGIAAMPCRQGMAWTRDQVSFRVLHPAHGEGEGNNASCVIEARVGQAGLLLTGDIESRVERALLAADQVAPVDVALVPHHGSKTSSLPAFAEALAARYAIASAGYRNRWNMPVPDVVERWHRSGAEVMTTADSGAIGLRLCEDGATLRYRHRVDSRRFWTAY